MGGGGGPGREIPEQVIQDALNNGEDFTLAENETTTFTEDLEIPQGRTLTVKGTLDLGDGNTLTENGRLVIDGGRIINDLGSVKLISDQTTRILGQILIDGVLTLGATGIVKQIEVEPTPESAIPVIKAGTARVEGTTVIKSDKATFDIGKYNLAFDYLEVEDSDEAYTFDVKNLSFIVINRLDIASVNVLQLDNKSLLGIHEDCIANIKGTLSLDVTHDGTEDTGKIDNNGVINVIDAGKIINPNSNTGAEITSSISSGLDEKSIININGADSMIENVKISNNTVTIGTPDSATGRVFLGKFNEFPAQLSSSLGEGALTWNSKFEDRTKITCYTSQGVWFVDDDSIQFSKEGATENFPQGAPTTVGLIDKYPQADNPGFLIEDNGADKDGSVFKLDAINDPTGQKISVDP